ncbi:MAG: TPM domain-containing protein [Phycisphaerae bacterium]|nr:TPM domain-containing protein [Phycisphaerae bacterium]
MKNNLFCSLFIVCVALCSVLALAVDTEKSYAPYPQPDRGYVTDHARLLTSEQEEELESWIYTCEKENGFEMAVVTIDSINDYPGTANSSIESFATGLFDAYGIGNMPRNDGVLLVVAVKDRKARIELGAYYGHSRDGAANRIMQKVIIPQFKKDRYDKGIINGTRALIREFGHMILIPGWVKLVVIGLIIFLIPVTISLFRSGKRGWGWICVGFIIILLLVLFVMAKKTVQSLPEAGSADGGVGGFGGGFGGGFSGGGGATGSW